MRLPQVNAPGELPTDWLGVRHGERFRSWELALRQRGVCGSRSTWSIDEHDTACGAGSINNMSAHALAGALG